MKKTTFLLVLATIFMFSQTFTSCDDEKQKPETEQKGNSSSNGGNNGGNTNSDIQAFFPSTYANKTLAAWYMLTANESNKTRVEAVFLFTDNYVVVTKHTVYSEGQNRDPERKIEAEGTYTITQGDFTNGSAQASVEGYPLPVTITNGQLTAMGETFTKQDNAQKPTPSDPTGNNNQGGGNGDDNYNGEAIAFLPNTYANKTLAAWYSLTDKSVDRIKIQSVFLFDDHTFVVTNSKVYSKQSNQTPTRKIDAEGTYTLQGTYTTGTGKAQTVIEGNPSDVDIVINNGQLTAMQETFTKQDNAQKPTPSDPTGNNNQGGGNGDDNQGGDQGDDIQAFFPNSHDPDKVVAWYLLTTKNDERTRADAIFLFVGDTLINTYNKVYSKEQNRDPERAIDSRAEFTIIDGDYTNGKIKVQGMIFEIKEGKIAVEKGSYTKQDNKQIPTPSAPTGNNNQGGGNGDDNHDDQGGDDQGDDNYTGEPQAYYPVDYTEKNIDAWFISADVTTDKIKILALFLFNDKTFIVTKSKFYSTADSRDPEYEIEKTGTFTISSGNYITGNLIGTIDNGGGNADITINNGIVSVGGETFCIQEIDDLPEPI